MIMRRNLKRILAIMLVGIFCLQIIGCGKEQEQGMTTQTSEFVYVAKFQPIEDAGWVDQFAVDGNLLYYMSNSYDEELMTSLTELVCLDTVSDSSSKVKIPLEENVSIQQFTINNQGNLVCLLNEYKIIDEDYENAEQHYYIASYSTDGTQISSFDITETILAANAENVYIQYMVVDNEDRIFITSGEGNIIVFNADGTKAFDLSLGENGWINSFGRTKDGTVVFCAYGQEGQELRTIDVQTKGFGDTYTGFQGSNGNINIYPGIEGDVLIAGSNGIFDYSFETKESTEVLNWVDSDIVGDYVRGVSVLEDGRIAALIVDYSGETSRSEFAYLTKTPSSEIVEKQIITLGVIYNDQTISRSVIDFNKSNDKYRIRIVDYYNNDDYEAGVTQFNNDLLTGNGTDIFSLDAAGNLSRYAAKGIIEDLTPFLEKDEDISASDFFPSVLKAYSYNGVLCTIPKLFYLNTLVGKKEDVGEEPGWSLTELMEAAEKMPEGSEIFEYASKEYIIQLALMFNTSVFVDWATGECNFNGEEFVKVLEFANRFPGQEEFEWDPDAETTPEKIAAGKLLLQSAGITQPQDIQIYDAMYGEGTYTFIGYPNSEGNSGTAMSGSSAFAINANSKNKDAAWEFIKSMLVKESYSATDSWGFPSRMDAFEESMEEAMKVEYYTDENGEQVEISNGGMSWDGFSIELYASSEEEVAQVRELIDNCSITYSTDTDLHNIIIEEAASFFQGQKTAQEAADIIQGRAKIYVSENR